MSKPESKVKVPSVPGEELSLLFLLRQDVPHDVDAYHPRDRGQEVREPLLQLLQRAGRQPFFGLKRGKITSVHVVPSTRRDFVGTS